MRAPLHIGLSFSIKTTCQGADPFLPVSILAWGMSHLAIKFVHKNTDNILYKIHEKDVRCKHIMKKWKELMQKIWDILIINIHYHNHQLVEDNHSQLIHDLGWLYDHFIDWLIENWLIKAMIHWFKLCRDQPWFWLQWLL